MLKVFKNNMEKHFKIVCVECGDTIAQCRCISKDKEISYKLCDKCRKDKEQAIFH